MQMDPTRRSSTRAAPRDAMRQSSATATLLLGGGTAPWRGTGKTASKLIQAALQRRLRLSQCGELQTVHSNQWSSGTGSSEEGGGNSGFEGEKRRRRGECCSSLLRRKSEEERGV
jgi:hypothetical protein